MSKYYKPRSKLIYYSSKSRDKKKKSDPPIPAPWSEWEWSKEESYYWRARRNHKGEWEYETHKPKPIPIPGIYEKVKLEYFKEPELRYADREDLSYVKEELAWALPEKKLPKSKDETGKVDLSAEEAKPQEKEPERRGEKVGLKKEDEVDSTHGSEDSDGTEEETDDEIVVEVVAGMPTPPNERKKSLQADDVPEKKPSEQQKTIHIVKVE